MSHNRELGPIPDVSKDEIARAERSLHGDIRTPKGIQEEPETLSGTPDDIFAVYEEALKACDEGRLSPDEIADLCLNATRVAIQPSTIKKGRKPRK